MCSLLFNVGKHINITNLLRRLVIFQEKGGIGGEVGAGGGVFCSVANVFF